ncbi:MAG: FAD-dependent oxidoreductase [Chloroflexota bacterium]|nr:FAD-dependent oxidoreductase [Chloroflexota bacterium]
MIGRALVVGGNIEGVQAALDIANSGIEVSLIEQGPSLPVESGENAHLLRPRLLEAASHPNIQILTGANITLLEGDKEAFHIKLVQQPRYINTEACTSCGRCEQACPVTLSSRDKSDIRKAVHYPNSGLKSVPSTCLIEKTGVAPCTAACPAGINVQGYVALISKGKLREALDIVREAVPFPHILGRVCTHPCESVCTRGKVDQPIAIASLKRYLADMEPAQYTLMPTEVVAPDSPRRVAIIGSGPAGLTCARDLVRMGHNSTIFESLPIPGGMVAVGMPRFRLPHEVREAEINAITNLGIEIKMNTPIGKYLTLGDLKEQGYEAIFIASGAHKNPRMDIPGEDVDGVIDSIAFLRSVNLKSPIQIGKNVVVIGGGYTAIDSARTAIRRNSAKVRILYRRTADEMSATPAEILETIEEGVDLSFLVAPIRVIEENGRVVGIECQNMELGEPDESGRKRPIPIEGSTFTFECDTIIPAIGQLPDLGAFGYGDIQPKNNGKTMLVDLLTLATDVPGVFAGGDVVHGPRSMVEAVGDGRRAAVSIDRLLRGENISAGRTLERPQPVEVNIDEIKIPPGGRRRIPVLPAKKRVGSFEEVETGYTTFMALRESKRCLSCGGCSECMECVRACELEAINHNTQPIEMEIETGAIVFAKSGMATKQDQPGVHIIGTNENDSDITNRLACASAIADKVLIDLSECHSDSTLHKSSLASPAENERIILEKPRIGVFICQCGGNISNAIDVSRIIRQFFRQSGIAHAQEIGYACSDSGASEIRDAAREQKLTHVVLAACACCALDQICFSCSDRRIECKNKLLGHALDDGLVYEFVNIREHCAWVHARETDKAFAKAKALIRAGIARASQGQPQTTQAVAIKRSVLVIGGNGPAGLQAAVDLSAQGIQTTLFKYGKNDESDDLSQQLSAELQRHGARILNNATLNDVSGQIGDYTATIEHEGKPLSLNIGAIIVDLSATERNHLPPLLQMAVRNDGCNYGEFDQSVSRIPGIFRCGFYPVKSTTALIQGSAAAAKISALLHSGEVQMAQTTAIIDSLVCRGCGTCTAICEFGAASLFEQQPGVFISRINEVLCRGCGTCVAHCPSCAISQNGISDRHIAAALEAILSPL